jgi:hypothetical protein
MYKNLFKTNKFNIIKLAVFYVSDFFYNIIRSIQEKIVQLRNCLYKYNIKKLLFSYCKF